MQLASRCTGLAGGLGIAGTQGKHHTYFRVNIYELAQGLLGSLSDSITAVSVEDLDSFLETTAEIHRRIFD